MNTKTHTGLVIARYGQTAEVEAADGSIIACHMHKNKQPVVTGDKVYWQKISNDQGIISDVIERHTVLLKADKREGTKAIAANVDLMFIVVASEPELSHHLIDRYLVAAENLAIKPIIVLNKIDLLDNTDTSAVLQKLAIYQDIGYDLYQVSAKQVETLSVLKECLKNKTSIFVGQSGVGKSTITASLIPALKDSIETNPLKSASKLGKHTTTVTRLYHCPESGDIIDSPGVRDFALWPMDANDIMRGFIEFNPFLGNCQFRNCIHQQDTGCAIYKAYQQGKISEQRLASYKQLLNILKKN